MECLVPVSNPAGRAFQGNHGDGGNPPWDKAGFGMRGGGYGDGGGHYQGFGGWAFQVSNRYVAGAPGPYFNARHYFTGFRCVRTAP